MKLGDYIWSSSVPLLLVIMMTVWTTTFAKPYDPTDKDIETILPPEGTFEAFYPRETNGIQNSVARAPHGHATFYKHRHPALIDTKNAAAYGYRFDGKRRFNFD
jgi:hypothetical protein